MTLRGLRVALGVTGGIAAYKSCELASLLKKQGAQVRCELASPSGDPRAYRVRGALVALRQENARNIFVEG